MARWSIVREGRGAGKLVLKYKNLMTEEEVECGRLMSDVPDAWVLDWIFAHAEHLHSGDFIEMSNGRVLHYTALHEARA